MRILIDTHTCTEGWKREKGNKSLIARDTYGQTDREGNTSK